MKVILILFVFFGLFDLAVQAQINFAKPKFGSVGSSYISSVAIGDVNNDGRNDALVATTFYFDENHDYSVFVFLQQADGTMAEPVRYPYSPAFGTSTVVQVADVNNDNRNDVIFSYSDSLGIRFQDDAGGLGEVHSFYSGNITNGMKTGDFNNDGLTDIVVSHLYDTFLKIFYQKTNNTFNPVVYPIKNRLSNEIDVNDMNNDGLDDIIAIPDDQFGIDICVYFQDSINGMDSVPVGYSYNDNSFESFHGIATGDMNNDGRNDLVGSTGGNNARIVLIYQKKDGTLEYPTYLNSFDLPVPVEIADLNCDGKNEIIAGNNSSTFFSVWEPDTTGKYSGYKLFPGMYYVGPYSMAVGDLNGDSRPDVLTTQGFSVANFVYNITAPDGTVPTGTIIKYSELSVDTINSTVNTQMMDETYRKNSCLIHSTFKLKVTTYNTDTHYIGDTLFPRSFFSCGVQQNDTIRHHFETNRYESLYHYDTTIFSSDTLLENNHVVGTSVTNDTLILEHRWSDVFFEQSYVFTPDTMFVYVDSIRVDFFLLETVVRDIYHIANEATKCGFIYRDTTTFAMTQFNTIVMKQSDTTFISRSVKATLLGIDETKIISDIRIYPNPAQDQFIIEVTGLEAENKTYSIQLISMEGQSVWKTQLKAQPDLRTSVDVSNLPRGIYTILISGNKSAGTSKVIIEN